MTLSTPLSQGSRLVQRLRRRYADVLPLLAPGAPSLVHLQATYQALRDIYPDVGDALRV